MNEPEAVVDDLAKHLSYFTTPDKEEIESNALYDTTDYGEKGVVSKDSAKYVFPKL